MLSLIVCLFLLSASQCYGAPGTTRDSRIYGGTVASEGEFPFMVYFIYYDNFHCSGTILNENWVLGAARCIDGYTLEALTVHAGSIKIGSGVSVGVTEAVVHDSFDEMAYTNDIALLKLAQPLRFSSTIQPVSLPSPGQETAAGTIGTAVGWGTTESSSHVGGDLRKVDVPVWSDADCSAAFVNFPFYPYEETNICAGEADKATCGGDEGCALLVNGQLVGLGSWVGYNCATADSPGVFTEVSHYVDWINQHAV